MESKSTTADTACGLCGLLGAAHAKCSVSTHALCRNCHRAFEQGLCRSGELDYEISDNFLRATMCHVDRCKGFLELTTETIPTAPIAQTVRLLRLKSGVEFDAILKKFAGGVGSLSGVNTKWIQEIYSVDNAAVKTIFEACKARMNKEGRQIRGKEVGANEHLLFHAANRIACGGIIREGFDMRRNGSANGQAYGAGAYFAAGALTSHGYSRSDGRGQRCMLLCRVLLGATDRDSIAVPGDVYVVNREQQLLPTYWIIYADPAERLVKPKGKTVSDSKTEPPPAKRMLPGTGRKLGTALTSAS